jgi:hypothetical protein
MSSALTEETVRKYVRLSLGHPVITVELEDEQIDAMANQALGIYGTHKPIEKYATTPIIPPGQKYTLAANSYGRGVIEVFVPDLLRQPISLDQFDVFKYHTRLPNLDPGDYYAERVWWKEVRRSAGSDEDWFITENHDGTAEIYITPIPSQSYVLGLFFVVDPTFGEVPPTDDDWVLDYTLAMCMELLGRIRSKFTAIQGAETSLDMDGETLRSEGNEKRRDMEEYLTGRGQVIAPIRG